MADHMRRSLCISALKQACIRRNPPKTLIHHSDRGKQYASEEYRAELKRHEIKASMSRRGNCYDNAMVESFFHTLKVELVSRKKYQTRTEAITDIRNYIETFYNRVTRHSALDYLSPIDYENKNKKIS